MRCNFYAEMVGKEVVDKLVAIKPLSYLRSNVEIE